LTDEQWKNAERGRFYRPVKRQITARVDADVLEWLKSQGKGYSETRIGVTRSLGVQVDATPASATLHKTQEGTVILVPL